MSPTIDWTLQNRGSNPRGWFLVKASAGSGKTHLLVNRLARIYFGGDGPGQFMGVTFTKKASNEMKERLLDRARELLKDAEPALLQQLGVAQDNPETEAFFWDVLDHFSRMHVSTIHSFCNEVVARFPLECGLPAKIKVLDSVESEELKRQTLDGFLQEPSLREPDTSLGQAWSVLSDSGLSVFGLTGQLNAAVMSVNLWRYWLLRLTGGEGVEDPLLISDEELGERVNEVQRDLFGVLVGPSDDPHQNHKVLHALEEGVPALQQLVFVLKEAKRAKLAQNLAEELSTWLSDPDPIASRNSEVLEKLEGLLAVDNPKAKWVETVQQTSAFLEAREGWLPFFRWKASLRFGAWARLMLEYLVRYQRAKKQMGGIDFSDMEWFAYRLLARTDRDSWANFVLFSLSQSLRHLAVDEFQDTALIQWEVLAPLIDLLSGIDTQQSGSVFCVGDLKQSIYRFRQAEPELMAAAETTLAQKAEIAGREFESIRLPASFRSSPAVLSFVDRVFELEDEDYPNLPTGETTRVDPFRDGASAYGSVVVEPVFGPEASADSVLGEEEVQFPTPLERRARLDGEQPLDAEVRGARWMAELVDRLVGKEPVWDPGLKRHRPARYSDIVVLFQSRTYSDVFEEAFKQRQLPFVTAGKSGMESRSEFKDLLNILQFILKPRDELLLYLVLRSPLFRISDKDLVKVQTIPHKLKGKGGRRAGLLALLRELSGDRRLPRSLRSALPRIEELLSFFRKRPTELFVHLERRFRWIEVYEALFNPGVSSNIRLFWDKAVELENRGIGTLEAYVQYLKQLASGAEFSDAPLPATDQGGMVRFMTIHGAKGLEAPIVILPDAFRGKGPQMKQSTPLALRNETDRRVQALMPSVSKLYPLAGSLGRPDPYFDLEAAEAARFREEEACLHYVALTRARDHLFIAGFARTLKAQAQSTLHKASYQVMEKWADDLEEHPESGWVVEREAVDNHEFRDLGTERFIVRYGARPVVEESVEVETPPALEEKLGPLDDALWRVVEEDYPSSGDVSNDDGEAPAKEEPYRSHSGATDPETLDKMDFFRRKGQAVHAILEQAVDGMLPSNDLAKGAASGFLRPTDPLDDVVKEAFAVLTDEGLKQWFDLPSWSEQPLMEATSDVRLVYGVADRIVRDGNTWVVIDYKTHPYPDRVRPELLKKYSGQIRAYCRMLESSLPEGQEVRGAILWTTSRTIHWVER